MSNIQKSFKRKAKYGLRAFSLGGVPGISDTTPDAKYGGQMSGAYGGIDNAHSATQLANFNKRMSAFDTPQNTGVGVLQDSTTDDWNAQFDARRAAEQANAPRDGTGPDGIRRPAMATQAGGLRAFEFGGSLRTLFGSKPTPVAAPVTPTDDPVARAQAALAASRAKYGGAPATPAAAPVAPAPVQVAAPAPTVQGAVQTLRGRGAAIDAAAGYANGGEIEPFVDGAGFIHGAPGVDKVPAQVAETGEPIRVGSGERIVNQKQNEALEHLAQKTTGQPLDGYLEEATGEPVGPKMKRGIRAAENGFNLEEVNARAAQARAINPTAPAPAPMMEPLEIPASQPAATARTGVGGMVDKAKAAASGVADKAKGLVSSAPAAEAPPPKWYQPSEGVKKVARGIRGGAQKAPGILAPVAALVGTHDAVEGFQNQANRSVEDIEDRGGFLASSMKDAFPTISAAGEWLGQQAARGVDYLSGGAAPAPDSFSELLARNKGVGSVSARSADKAASAKEAQAAASAVPPAATKITENPEDNANIRSLRSTGVQGVVGGDDPRLTAPEDMSKGPQMRGIRTIDTANGKVYAGRDAKGQLNVTAGLDQTAGEAEAARAKEAARMNADMKRQVETFDRLALERDMKSNNPADRASAAQRMGLRQLDAQIAQANQANETTRRGQDVEYQAKLLDNQSKIATLKNQQAQQNFERYGKNLDGLFGKDDPKDNPQGSAQRREFENDIMQAFAEHNIHPSQIPVRDLAMYKKMWEQMKEAEPGTAGKMFRNWVLNKPWVKDPNVFRQLVPQGPANSLGFADNANGAAVYTPDVVGKNFVTGEYDRQLGDVARRGLNR